MIESQPAENPSELTWVVKLPLVRDPIFIRQMSLVFLAPLVVLGLLMIVISWPLNAESLSGILKIVLVTGGVMLALYVFVVFGVLRGRQEIRYTLGRQGAREETAGPLKHINLVRWLLLASGKPTHAGIGVLTRGPKSQRVTWERVEELVPDPQAKTITLRQGHTDLMILHGTEENYEQVLAWVQAHTRLRR